MKTIALRRNLAAKKSEELAEVSAPLVVAFPSELGWMALVWNERGVCELSFARKSKSEALATLRQATAKTSLREQELSHGLAAVVDLLQRYAAGEDVNLDEVPVDTSKMSAFQRRVVDACRRIPRGTVVTYQELGGEAGSPRSARAVGNVMRQNAVPLLIPCHRVVGSGGSLGGYSAPTGLTMKRRLLKLEGREDSGRS